MSTRIRLRRMGAKKRPFYRVVVADQRSPRDGRFIENIGKYHPLEDPSLIEIDEERALHWLRTGAQPSEQVQNLMSKIGIWDKFVAERPKAAAKSRTNRAAAKPEVEKKSKKAKAAEVAAASAPAEAAAPVEEPAPVVAEEPVADVVPAAPAEAAADVSEAPAEAPAEEAAEAAPEAAAQETAEAAPEGAGQETTEA